MPDNTDGLLSALGADGWTGRSLSSPDSTRDRERCSGSLSLGLYASELVVTKIPRELSPSLTIAAKVARATASETVWERLRHSLNPVAGVTVKSSPQLLIGSRRVSTEEHLHFLQRDFSVLVGIDCLEESGMGRLDFLKRQSPVAISIH
jgi:hypothetical protein